MLTKKGQLFMQKKQVKEFGVPFKYFLSIFTNKNNHEFVCRGMHLKIIACPFSWLFEIKKNNARQDFVVRIPIYNFCFRLL